MKVKKLISLLKKFDENAEVHVTNYDDPGMWEYTPETVSEHTDLSGDKDGDVVLEI